MAAILALPRLGKVQFLEGFALGSAVVDAGFGRVKAYLLALFYSISTPLGIAIGEAPFNPKIASCSHCFRCCSSKPGHGPDLPQGKGHGHLK
jgi:zinc transporter ZupT